MFDFCFTFLLFLSSINLTHFTDNMEYIDDRIEVLLQECRNRLETNQKFPEVVSEIYLHLRYEGTDCALMCQPQKICDKKLQAKRSLSKRGDFIASFVERLVDGNTNQY